METKAEPEACQTKVPTTKKVAFRLILSLILVDFILVIIIFSFTSLFYRTMEEQIYMERTSYLEEITSQIVSSINTVSDAQWDFAEIFANHLINGNVKQEDDLTAYIGQEEAAFSQSGLMLLAFDQDGRYYDAAGNRAKWGGALAVISSTAPERQLEITSLPTSTETDDEMVFIQKMIQPISLKSGVLLTHVAVVRNMSVFSDMFHIPSFKGSGENYIISNTGTRIYRGQGSDSLIGDVYNVLKPMEAMEFQFDGSYEVLKDAVANSVTCSLEFISGGQGYYVTSSPVGKNGWSLLNLVPATVVNVKMQRFMNMMLLGMAAIALTIMVMVTLTLFLMARYRTGRQLMRQQELTNAALRDAANAAEEANRAKSVFLSHMSHDIRTPINGIMGMTDIALRNMEDRPRVKDCLDKISSASHHLLRLVNDVLDMSRIENGKVEIENVSFCVDTLLDGCYSVIMGQASEKNINLRRDFSRITQHYLLGDELHLRQIFINILGNAVKFTPEAGEIEFSAEDKPSENGESMLTVVIRDNGIGMSEDFQKKIFEPFSQAEDANRSKYKGTGLGMSIVKQLTDLMGGEITVHSSLGAGSTFTFRLRLPEQDAPAQMQSTDGETGDLTGMRILLAEDNELNMEIAIYILEECGVQVVSAANGREALEQFTQRPAGSFDVILMDIMMPVMDGVEAARAIRSSGKDDAADIPIVAMTANAYAEDRQITMEAGMNRHLAKPIEREELIRALSELRREIHSKKQGGE